jgi:hypothetical protein
MDSDFWHLELTSVYVTPEMVKNASRMILDPQDIAEFIMNNSNTGNMNVMLHVIANELAGLPRNFDVPFPWLINILFLSRAFMVHFVSVKQNLKVLFEVKNGENICRELTIALVSVLADVDLNPVTADLHLEIIKLLIVLCSSQMFGNGDFAPFIDFVLELDRDKLMRLSNRLLNVFIQRVPDNQSIFQEESKRSGLLSGMFSSILNLFAFPFQIYNYLFQQKTESLSLSDHALQLLLILAHQKFSKGSNEFQSIISSLEDENFDSPKNDNTPLVSFSRLFDALVNCLPDSKATLAICMLFRFNKLFKEYMFVKSDLSSLISPMLCKLYQEAETISTETYVILIILLILSEDPEFSRFIHTRLQIESVPWTKDVLIKDISLGSLLMFVILKLAQYNLSKRKDPYIHSNSLAILCNISIHGKNLHFQTAQKIVQLLSSLQRRFSGNERKKSDADIEEKTPENKDNSEELGTFGELVRLLLEVLNSCLSDQNLIGNEELVYCLLVDSKSYQGFENHEHFWDLAGNLVLILSYFRDCIEKAALPEVSVDSIKQVITKSARFYDHPESQTLHEVTLSRFNFEELPDSEEFFLAQIWENCVSESGISWPNTLITLFKPNSAKSSLESV